jgi:hypothetical protein
MNILYKNVALPNGSCCSSGECQKQPDGLGDGGLGSEPP